MSTTTPRTPSVYRSMGTGPPMSKRQRRPEPPTTGTDFRLANGARTHLVDGYQSRPHIDRSVKGLNHSSRRRMSRQVRLRCGWPRFDFLNRRMRRGVGARLKRFGGAGRQGTARPTSSMPDQCLVDFTYSVSPVSSASWWPCSFGLASGPWFGPSSASAPSCAASAWSVAEAVSYTHLRAHETDSYL